MKLSPKYSILDLWPIITSTIFIVFIAGSLISKQEAQAQRVEKLELIRDDINQIKIHMERIDVTLEQINKNKGR
jgi:hypothetical protein